MPINYKLYPKNWKDIRAEVLERAGHKCEQCKVKNYDYVWRAMSNGVPVYQTADCAIYNGLNGDLLDEGGLDIPTEGNEENKLTKIVLTISHTDHDITNNGNLGDRPNLRALCQRCHLHHDRHEHAKNSRETRRRKLQITDLFPNEESTKAQA